MKHINFINNYSGITSGSSKSIDINKVEINNDEGSYCYNSDEILRPDSIDNVEKFFGENIQEAAKILKQIFN